MVLPLAAIKRVFVKLKRGFAGSVSVHRMRFPSVPCCGSRVQNYAFL